MSYIEEHHYEVFISVEIDDNGNVVNETTLASLNPENSAHWYEGTIWCPHTEEWTTWDNALGTDAADRAIDELLSKQ